MLSIVMTARTMRKGKQRDKSKTGIEAETGGQGAGDQHCPCNIVVVVNDYYDDDDNDDEDDNYNDDNDDHGHDDDHGHNYHDN